MSHDVIVHDNGIDYTHDNDVVFQVGVFTAVLQSRKHLFKSRRDFL